MYPSASNLSIAEALRMYHNGDVSFAVINTFIACIEEFSPIIEILDELCEKHNLTDVDRLHARINELCGHTEAETLSDAIDKVEEGVLDNTRCHDLIKDYNEQARSHYKINAERPSEMVARLIDNVLDMQGE